MERYIIDIVWNDNRVSLIHINSKRRAEILIYALIDRKYSGEMNFNRICLYDTKTYKFIREEK